MKNLALCNNCAGKIVPSLQQHYVERGLCFCSYECAQIFFSPDNLEPEPVGLWSDFNGGF